jgi:hypothetical protein
MTSQPKSSLLDVFLRTWYLGFTSFGGPAVHFQIFHRIFVEGQNPWLDEQTVGYLSSAFSNLGFHMPLHSFRSFFPFVRLFQGQPARNWDSGILHSIHTGRIFGSRHVFLDLEVSSRSESSRPVDPSFGFTCLWQSGIEWARSPFTSLHVTGASYLN